MATKSSTQPANSKPTTSQVKGVHSQVTPTTSTTTLPSMTNPATSQSGGIGELAHALAVESGKRLEAARKGRFDSSMGKTPQQGSARPKEPREGAPGRTPSTSPARRYALELWVQMESSPGVFGPPDEDSYSVDFIVDTLNQAYPGCTGVYLSDAGHILAFYGKQGAPNAGLTLEQGMEACMIIQEIQQWMGSLAQVKVRAVSLEEAKVSIPAYFGKGGHVNHVSAFRAWAHSITYYHNYYEDHYLFPLVVALVKDDAAEMFDFACSNIRGDSEDLGQIVQRMMEHYCGTFTFREQRIQVENMKQGNSEEAADFLVKVTNAVNGLAKDWKGHLTEEELDTLQYEVFLNGVKKEIRHMLDAEVAKHPHMTPDQMYTTVRRFESYVAHNERLDGKEATPTRAKALKAPPQATPTLQT